jgi:hypothetical protein
MATTMTKQHQQSNVDNDSNNGNGNGDSSGNGDINSEGNSKGDDATNAANGYDVDEDIGGNLRTAIG